MLKKSPSEGTGGQNKNEEGIARSNIIEGLEERPIGGKEWGGAHWENQLGVKGESLSENCQVGHEERRSSGFE